MRMDLGRPSTFTISKSGWRKKETLLLSSTCANSKRARTLKVPTSDKNSPRATAVAFLGIPVKCSVKGFVNLYCDVALRKIIYFVLRGMIFLDE